MVIILLHMSAPLTAVRELQQVECYSVKIHFKVIVAMGTFIAHFKTCNKSSLISLFETVNDIHLLSSGSGKIGSIPSLSVVGNVLFAPSQNIYKQLWRTSLYMMAIYIK